MHNAAIHTAWSSIVMVLAASSIDSNTASLLIPSQCYVVVGKAKHIHNNNSRPSSCSSIRCRSSSEPTKSKSYNMNSPNNSNNHLCSLLLLTPSQCIRTPDNQQLHVRRNASRRLKNRSTTTKLRAMPDEGTNEDSDAPNNIVTAHPGTSKRRTALNTTMNDDSSLPSTTEEGSLLVSSTSTSSNRHNKRATNEQNSRTKAKRNNNNKNQTRKRTPVTGDVPNISWRAIPMHHLRQHPSFDALPHPSEITEIASWDDISQFRQDSVQWDLLHSGRCTTSRAACALGILEPKAAAELGIPVSLRKRGLSACEHLKGRAITGLEEMNTVLCGQQQQQQQEYYDGGDFDDYGMKFTDAVPTTRIWSKPQRAINDSSSAGLDDDDDSLSQSTASRQGRVRTPHVAQYLRKPSICSAAVHHASPSQRQHASTVIQARMRWGSAQEPTSVLTALNYFCTKLDPGIRIREIGMCVGETSGHAHKLADGLLIGASPDAVIVYPDGRLEALEVKNHCPFVKAWWRRNINPETRKKFAIRCQVPDGEIPATYIPQLMMEMLCLGPACKSAIMVRQTATKGAIVLRLKRDDAWIDDMLHLLSRFHTEYVDTIGQDHDVQANPPPPNFFWDDEIAERRDHYRNFVKRTREIGKDCCEIVSYIEHRDIQRVSHFDDDTKKSVVTPLFLDDTI